jgi:hypothetical protein
MPIAAILPLLTQLLGLAAQAAVDGPKIVESVKSIWSVATSSTPPSADEQAEYDAALDAAHQALQNS